MKDLTANEPNKLYGDEQVPVDFVLDVEQKYLGKVLAVLPTENYSVQLSETPNKLHISQLKSGPINAGRITGHLTSKPQLINQFVEQLRAIDLAAGNVIEDNEPNVRCTYYKDENSQEQKCEIRWGQNYWLANTLKELKKGDRVWFKSYSRAITRFWVSVPDAMTGNVLRVLEQQPKITPETLESLKYSKYEQNQRAFTYNFLTEVLHVIAILYMFIGVALSVPGAIAGNKGVTIPHSLIVQSNAEAVSMLTGGFVFFVIALIISALRHHLVKREMATPWSMVLERIDEENQIVIGYRTRIVYWLAHHVQSAWLKKMLSPRYAQRFLEIQSVSMDVSMEMELIDPADRIEKQPVRYNV
ncbi:PDDEXK family nuclease [Furfurilactobacillus entadae]|uniref:hypothetical protein n=1 Tax=Furfurilactobacillus entadae TaxID=2922307 RepID=UPI0035F0322A